MEVKIKQGNEMLDATFEIVDGVMVVSPKEVKFEPKDGDVVYVKSLCDNIIIYKEGASGIGRYVNFSDNEYLYTDNNVVCDKEPVEEIRYATEEEKKKLFAKLEEEGYEFDIEKKELVKLKWNPKDHEKVYVAGFTFYGDNPFCAFEDTAYSGSMQWRAVFEKGWYFKTEQECQEFCDRLNEAINSVKQ